MNEQDLAPAVDGAVGADEADRLLATVLARLGDAPDPAGGSHPDLLLGSVFDQRRCTEMVLAQIDETVSGPMTRSLLEFLG